MKFNKSLKILALTIPMLAMTACSSTGDTEETNSSKESQAARTALEFPVSISNEMDSAQVHKRKMLVELSAKKTVKFGFDKFSVSDEFKETLNKHAEFLIDNPSEKLLISGHTDNMGSPGYNVALGDRRANAVAKYLNLSGVPMEQISTISYGEEKPINRGNTAISLSENRRAVLTY